MSQLTVNKIGPEAMADNPSRVDVADYTSGFREFKPVQHRDDWRLAAVKVGGALLALIVCWALFGLWKTAYCWGGANYLACQRIVEAEPIAVLLLFGGTAAVLVWKTVATTVADLRQKRAYAARTGLVLDRFGNQVPADLFDRMHPNAMLGYLERRYQMDVALKAQTAPYEVYWGVNSLSQNSSTQAASLPEPAAPGVDVGPLPVEKWLADLTDAYHILLAAETGGGKSTTAKALLARRIEAGDEVLVIDPHYAEGNWFELPGVGGGRNYHEVEAALGVVLDEMNARYEQYSRGKRDFRRLTVLIDETPAIYQQLGDAWKQFAKQLGSEARKVNISIVLLTQSPLVQDIGVNTSMQRNFRRVALDAATIRVMLERDELNRERREALAAMLAGRQYPATVELNGQVWLLDRTGLDQVPAPRNSADAAWVDGYDAVKGSCGGSFEDNTTQELLQELLRTNARTNERTKASKLDELRALRAAGITRERAREMGFAFTDADWTLAGR